MMDWKKWLTSAYKQWRHRVDVVVRTAPAPGWHPQRGWHQH